MLHTITARNLQANDVLAGSGFVVSLNPWVGVRTPSGKVNVEGRYPRSLVERHVWNANTTVTVRR